MNEITKPIQDIGCIELLESMIHKDGSLKINGTSDSITSLPIGEFVDITVRCALWSHSQQMPMRGICSHDIEFRVMEVINYNNKL